MDVAVRAMDEFNEAESPRRRKISLFGREFALPQSRSLRVTIGVVLVFLGCLGFLPVLGFWMIPLGLLVLSYEFARVRRWRRRTEVWWGERRGRRRGRMRQRIAAVQAAVAKGRSAQP